MKRRKCKKFNYLRYNPQKKPTATKNEDFIKEPKQFYAGAVKSQAPSRNLIKVNINNYQTLTINEKRQLLHQTKTREQKQGKLRMKLSAENHKTNVDRIKQL